MSASLSFSLPLSPFPSLLFTKSEIAERVTDSLYAHAIGIDGTRYRGRSRFPFENFVFRSDTISTPGICRPGVCAAQLCWGLQKVPRELFCIRDPGRAASFTRLFLSKRIYASIPLRVFEIKPITRALILGSSPDQKFARRNCVLGQ